MASEEQRDQGDGEFVGMWSDLMSRMMGSGAGPRRPARRTPSATARSAMFDAWADSLRSVLAVAGVPGRDAADAGRQSPVPPADDRVMGRMATPVPGRQPAGRRSGDARLRRPGAAHGRRERADRARLEDLAHRIDGLEAAIGNHRRRTRKTAPRPRSARPPPGRRDNAPTLGSRAEISHLISADANWQRPVA